MHGDPDVELEGVELWQNPQSSAGRPPAAGRKRVERSACGWARQRAGITRPGLSAWMAGSFQVVVPPALVPDPEFVPVLVPVFVPVLVPVLVPELVPVFVPLEVPVFVPEPVAVVVGRADGADRDIWAAVSDVQFGDRGRARADGGTVCIDGRRLPLVGTRLQLFGRGLGRLYRTFWHGGANGRCDGHLSQ